PPWPLLPVVRDPAEPPLVDALEPPAPGPVGAGFEGSEEQPVAHAAAKPIRANIEARTEMFIISVFSRTGHCLARRATPADAVSPLRSELGRYLVGESRRAQGFASPVTTLRPMREDV